MVIFQAVLQFDCATPLRGQFMTIQKYDHFNDRIFEMLEVDIEVYCGPFLNDQGNTCVINEGNACTRKYLTTKSNYVQIFC